MKTTTHTYTGYTVTVTPTMEALGDQPFRCRVYPDKLPGYYQGLMVEAGSREDAAAVAIDEFNKLYPNYKTK